MNVHDYPGSGQGQARRDLIDYTFSGSVSSTGRQVFTLDDPSQFQANVYSDALTQTYSITISGTGSGSVEIGATASAQVDAGGVPNWGMVAPAAGLTVPRLRLRGRRGITPTVVSITEDDPSGRSA